MQRPHGCALLAQPDEGVPPGSGRAAAIRGGRGRARPTPEPCSPPLPPPRLTGAGLRWKATETPPRRGNPGVRGRAKPSPGPFAPPLPPPRERGLGGEGGPGRPGRAVQTPRSTRSLPLSGRCGRGGRRTRAVPANPAAPGENRLRSDAYPCQPSRPERGPGARVAPAQPAGEERMALPPGCLPLPRAVGREVYRSRSARTSGCGRAWAAVGGSATLSLH